MQKPPPEQRAFFKQIAELAFTNPFSQERERQDCALLNISLGTLDIYQRSELIQALLLEQLPLNNFRITEIIEWQLF